MRVPLGDTTLMEVPEGVHIEEALLLGDVLSTGYFAARQAVEIVGPQSGECRVLSPPYVSSVG